MTGHEMGNFLEPTSDPAWVLAAQGYDPVREGVYEARFAISNGFLGIRAGRAVSRGSRWLDPQRTYVAGLFDIPGSEQPIPQLVTAPGFLAIRIIPDGGLLVHHPAEVGSHRTTLDMRRGALFTESRLADDPRIAVRVRTMRVVSLDDRSVGAHMVEVEVEHGVVGVTVETSFEGLGLGLKTEQLEQESWFLADPEYRKAPRCGCYFVLTGGRRRYHPGQARTVRMVVAMDNSPRPDRKTCASGGRRAGRCAGFRSRPGRTRKDWNRPAARLAKGGATTRDCVGSAMAA